MQNEVFTNILKFGGLIASLWACAQLGTWVSQNLSKKDSTTLSWLVYGLSLVILFMFSFIVTW